MPQARGRVELIEPLTPREQQVAQLLVRGLTNKEIAACLEITEHTIKFHVNGLLRKLGVSTRTEAVVQAARLGVVVL
jgi:two-component system, NarL family, nitrate/nitrite response regulator NarL